MSILLKTLEVAGNADPTEMHSSTRAENKRVTNIIVITESTTVHQWARLEMPPKDIARPVLSQRYYYIIFYCFHSSELSILDPTR